LLLIEVSGFPEESVKRGKFATEEIVDRLEGGLVSGGDLELDSRKQVKNHENNLQNS
jgi:hypothetical protein